MDLKEVLEKNNYRCKKALGQNFIRDTNLLEAIALDAELTLEDTVVEIGIGGATLTRILADKSKKVFAFEIDRDLEPIITEMLADKTNVSINFLDVLRISDEEFKKIVPGKFKVVANLPYYITSPLIMRFVESDLEVESLTVMVQKEVGDRLTAKADTPEYSAITCAVKLVGDAKITRVVNRKMFLPMPNVDSAVIHIKINRNKYNIPNLTKVKKLIRSAFLMRRKTFVNNLVNSFGLKKEEAKLLLTSSGYNENIRGEVLDVEDFVKLVAKLSN